MPVTVMVPGFKFVPSCRGQAAADARVSLCIAGTCAVSVLANYS
jgi:hypothetical protein